MRLRRRKRPSPSPSPASPRGPAVERCAPEPEAPPPGVRIDQLLATERIACDQCAGSKKRALETAAVLLAAAHPHLDATAVFASLMNRERLGSTGLGHGIALPHGRMAYAGPPLGAFITLREGIEFDALDGAPVQQLFALIIPEDATDEHLRILAALAQVFSDPDLRARLRECESPDRAIDLFRDA